MRNEQVPDRNIAMELAITGRLDFPAERAYHFGLVNTLCEEGEALARDVAQTGAVVRFVRTDVSEEADVCAMIEAAVAAHGRLDGAFNNAGIEGDPFIPLHKYSEDMWDSVVAINLKGVFLSMKYELPQILKNGGAIVNMASVAGLAGGRMGAAYHASKHGVVGITKAAAMEYADKGVRINAVAPAVIETAMADRAFFHDPAIAARVTGLHPVGRVGTPEEVANAVVWLCSREASFTTGHTFPVDGGFLVP